MATLAITRSNDVPNSTYFRTSDAEPMLEGDALTIYNGNGRSRSSWGAPGVTSTVVLEAGDLVAVHVGFHHKHGGGQFWRYYRPVGGQWQQVQWAQLSDDERGRVLTAQGAPSWAKTPGKLRTEKKAPELTTQTAYKIVRVLDDGRMVSLYDGETEYVLGKRLAERAIAGHRGGYYSYRTAADIKGRFLRMELVPERCYGLGMRVALLEVEASGTLVTYGDEWDEWGERIPGDKIASTYLRPVRVLETFDYAPAEIAAAY